MVRPTQTRRSDMRKIVVVDRGGECRRERGLRLGAGEIARRPTDARSPAGAAAGDRIQAAVAAAAGTGRGPAARGTAAAAHAHAAAAARRRRSPSRSRRAAPVTERTRSGRCGSRHRPCAAASNAGDRGRRRGHAPGPRCDRARQARTREHQLPAPQQRAVGSSMTARN